MYFITNYKDGGTAVTTDINVWKTGIWDRQDDIESVAINDFHSEPIFEEGLESFKYFLSEISTRVVWVGNHLYRHHRFAPDSDYFKVYHILEHLDFRMRPCETLYFWQVRDDVTQVCKTMVDELFVPLQDEEIEACSRLGIKIPVEALEEVS